MLIAAVARHQLALWAATVEHYLVGLGGFPCPIELHPQTATNVADRHAAAAGVLNET